MEHYYFRRLRHAVVPLHGRHLNGEPKDLLFVHKDCTFNRHLLQAFSLKKFKRDYEAKKEGTWFVFVRAMKLFWLGVAIQGGGWPDKYEYGWNLWNMRWCGILQRIAWGYFVVALGEIWLPVYDMSASMPEDLVHVPADPEASPEAVETTHVLPLQHLCRIMREQACIIAAHALKWLLAFAFVAIYLVALYQTYVPSWTIEFGTHKGKTIECNARGLLTPACAATGFYDRLLFGQKMTGTWMSQRSATCSSCSPGSMIYSTGASCFNATAVPIWCDAPLYDPEGALASVPP